MLGNISDEETNELIYIMSENFRKNLLGRELVESQLFPVSHYIGVACYINYDQSWHYNIFREIAKTISPAEIARRNKTLGSFLNQLAFNSLAMLYLHGRAQVIHDNIERKKKGEAGIEVEPEKKKKETKFIMDFWRNLSPNYRNDGALTTDDGTIRVLSQDTINALRQEMTPVLDKPELIKKVKRTMALMTNRNFLAQSECRAGIFEHGPYQTETPDELLIFKEFSAMYTGEDQVELNIGLDMPILDFQMTEAKAPVSNVIFGFTLKDMKKLEYNDWGTCFAEPPDYTQNITSMCLWTKDFMHPKDVRYPDNLGNVTKLQFEILDDLMDFSQKALNEMYIAISKWDFLRKLMSGVNGYSNLVPLLFSLHAGIEERFNWSWANDVLEDQQRSDAVQVADVNRYIEHLAKMPGNAHPFGARVFRRKRDRKLDPSYYPLQG